MRRPLNAALALVFSLVVTLAPREARAIALDEAITQYLARSPQVQGQKTLLTISENDRWRRFLVREPELQVSTADDNSEYSYGVSLTTPFPGKTFSDFGMDRTRAGANRLELWSKKNDAARLVAQTFMDCASNRALVDLQRKAVDDFATLARSLRTLYESGHSTQAEKIGAELQMRQASADLQASMNHSEVLCQKWHDLFGGEASADEVPADLQPETLLALGEQTADQARAKAAIEVAQATYDHRWWAIAPDVTWSATRNHYAFLPASPNGRGWTTTFGVSLTFPLLFPFSESVEARRAGAQATVDRNAAEIQRLNADADQMDAAKEFTRSQKRLKELHDSDIPLAEALVESTYAAYKIGKLGYAELILSRKTLLDLKTQEIQLRVAAVGARLRCLQSCQVKL
jgi:outer membrane protein TolC